MLKKIGHFLQYNNASLLILVIIFLLGSGVFAQTETGQELIGKKLSNVENIDNTLLLEADLEHFNMDFKIERIESDSSTSSGQAYYYITYTYLDLVKGEDAWEYELTEKIRKVSQKIKKDLGVYLGEELGEEEEARIKKLKKEKERALVDGPQKRIEVEEYSGLIGKTLKLGEKVFKNYEAVKVKEIPSPTIPPTVLISREKKISSESVADNLTDIYDDYLKKIDPDEDNILGELDNCPHDYNPDQGDEDEDGIGDVCDFGDEFFVDDNIATPTDDIINDDVASSGEESLLDTDDNNSGDNMDTNDEENLDDNNETSNSETENNNTNNENGDTVDDENEDIDNQGEIGGDEIYNNENEDNSEISSDSDNLPEDSSSSDEEEPDVEIIEIEN